jgi:hypothetical protein
MKPHSKWIGEQHRTVDRKLEDGRNKLGAKLNFYLVAKTRKKTRPKSRDHCAVCCLSSRLLTLPSHFCLPDACQVSACLHSKWHLTSSHHSSYQHSFNYLGRHCGIPSLSRTPSSCTIKWCRTTQILCVCPFPPPPPLFADRWQKEQMHTQCVHTLPLLDCDLSSWLCGFQQARCWWWWLLTEIPFSAFIIQSYGSVLSPLPGVNKQGNLSLTLGISSSAKRSLYYKALLHSLSIIIGLID